MEKNTPHCKLAVVKALVADGKLRMSASSVTSAELLGFDRQGMLEVVMNLETTDFYKSMTTHADHRIWQDVYHSSTPTGELYLKLTVIEDVLIVSFKEL
jgi:motility quorum-sensing regulator / GCU-specific mRNA interferase toxin